MNATIARLALRSLLGQRRGLVLAILPALLVALALVTTILTEGSVAFEPIEVVLGFGLVLPLVALLVTGGVLGPEIDDGSIVYLLAKPLSRYVVALSKLAVAAGVTLVLGAGALLAAGLVLAPDEPGQALAIAGGGAVSALAYCALFVMLSAITRHGMVAGLLYVLVLEGLLASSLSGLRYLSVGAFGRRVAEGLDPSLGLGGGALSLTYAVLAAAVVLLAGSVVAGERLRSFQLRGDE